MHRIYLDYAASTPVDKAVKTVMEPYSSEIFGNPGALHWFGQEASAAVFKAREAIAEFLRATYKEIIFTGSATEANNLALRGAVKYCKADKFKKIKIITTAIEHESVLETCRDLENEGVEVVYIPVSKEGIVDVEKLKSAIDERTVLISVMYANNEVGTIQPISEISKIIKAFKDKHPMSPYPLFHTDAVQALQYLDCDINKLGVDLMTLSAHKIYGPKGIGMLYARNSHPKPNIINPIITGGGQERGLRSGTENVANIVGFAKAMELVHKVKNSEAKRISGLRGYLLRSLKKISASRRTKISVNGDLRNRLPNNLNVYVPGHNAGDLLIKLDLAGVAISPGSACSARLAKPSYVLEAMGLPRSRCAESLRMTLGRQTTKADIDKMLKIMLKIL